MKLEDLDSDKKNMWKIRHELKMSSIASSFFLSNLNEYCQKTNTTQQNSALLNLILLITSTAVKINP